MTGKRQHWEFAWEHAVSTHVFAISYSPQNDAGAGRQDVAETGEGFGEKLSMVQRKKACG